MLFRSLCKQGGGQIQAHGREAMASAHVLNARTGPATDIQHANAWLQMAASQSPIGQRKPTRTYQFAGNGPQGAGLV